MHKKTYANVWLFSIHSCMQNKLTLLSSPFGSYRGFGGPILGYFVDNFTHGILTLYDHNFLTKYYWALIFSRTIGIDYIIKNDCPKPKIWRNNFFNLDIGKNANVQNFFLQSIINIVIQVIFPNIITNLDRTFKKEQNGLDFKIK